MSKAEQLKQYRRLLSYAARFKIYFAISLIGFTLYAAMEAALLRSIELFINTLDNKPTEWLVELGLDAEILQAIWFLPSLVVVLALIRGIGSYLGNFYMSRLGLGVVNALRKQVFRHLLYLPQEYFDKHNSGTLVSLIIYNVEQVTGSVTRAVKVLFNDGIMLIVLLICLLWMNWKLTFAFVVITPILAVLVLFAAQYFRKTSRKIQRAVGEVTHVTKEALQAIKVVKSYGGENHEVTRFNHAADNNLKYSVKFERVNALQTPVMHVVIACALATIMALVVMFWPPGDAAGAVAYVTFAGMIAKPFRQLSNINSIIQKGMAAAETIFAAIDEKPEVDSGTQKLDQVEGTVSFQNVSFSYDGIEKVLDSVSFEAKAGETVALVGHSGSGKTTLASLLLRFYTPDRGLICIDDKPLNEIELASLRNKVALVNQMTMLFNDSVEHNVSYGKEGLDREKLVEALEQAYALPFVEKLDEGSATDVGEDGDRLSGGQRQRVAIARALYKDAPILILDEATSALDNESEKKIQLALEQLKQGRTTLVIAHRLSTIQSADKIIVMDKGKIVEQGNHESLLALNGHYAKLYHSHE
jgi:subfamily B ATP-binding cassette protein MsbA